MLRKCQYMLVCWLCCLLLKLLSIHFFSKFDAVSTCRFCYTISVPFFIRSLLSLSLLLMFLNVMATTSHCPFKVILTLGLSLLPILPRLTHASIPQCEESVPCVLLLCIQPELLVACHAYLLILTYSTYFALLTYILSFPFPPLSTSKVCLW